MISFVWICDCSAPRLRSTHGCLFVYHTLIWLRYVCDFTLRLPILSLIYCSFVVRSHTTRFFVDSGADRLRYIYVWSPAVTFIEFTFYIAGSPYVCCPLPLIWLFIFLLLHLPTVRYGTSSRPHLRCCVVYVTHGWIHLHYTRLFIYHDADFGYLPCAGYIPCVVTFCHVVVV